MEKTWKQIYLERNLQEFLENIQSSSSMAQELHVLKQQPLGIENKEELEIIKKYKSRPRLTPEEYKRTEEELMKELNQSPEKPQPSKEPINNTTFDVLHSHKMKPNLNYYLLHSERDKNGVPNLEFRQKLKQLFDGCETQSTRYIFFFNSNNSNSRLTNPTNNDDIFTFYYNAIHRSYYRGNNDTMLTKDVQYWLLSKKDQFSKLPGIDYIFQ